MVHHELWLTWLTLCLVAGASCRRVPLKAPRLPAARRALAGYEDGVCDEERYSEDPDCDSSGGGVPATACARTAGMAAAAGFPGACMVDPGCMSIQMLQLDSDCGGIFASPPACTETCYTVAASIGEACRWELLSWERQFNARQMAWGGQQIWIWQPLFGTCGLAGGSTSGSGGTDGGGAPVVTEPPPGGDSHATAAGDETFCDQASQAAEKLGYISACRNDTACQAANVTQMDIDCAGAFAAAPSCSEACNASLATISEGCRWELLLWQEAYNNESLALGAAPVEIWNVLYTACNLTAAAGANNTSNSTGGGDGGSGRITLNRLPDSWP